MATQVAIIAQDGQQEQLRQIVQAHQSVLCRYPLIAPEATAQEIARTTTLAPQALLALHRGGITQIAARVAQQEVVAVLYLADPETLGQQSELQTLQRLCVLYDVPLGLNPSTIAAILDQLRRSRVAHLIFNPVSGQSDAVADLKLIQSVLGSAMTLHVHKTSPDTHPAELVQAAIASQADLVIAAGGDGTVSAVAGALMGSQIPLGIIPRGTANAFAAALGITGGFMQLRNACRIIVEGKTAVVDVARCNGQPMILLAGIGLEAEVVERANREAKDRWGALAYIMEGIRQFNAQELFETEIEIEGVVKQFNAGAVTIANAAPPTSVMAQGGGTVNATDGLLDITVAAPQSDLEALGAMVNLVGAALLRTPTSREDIINLQTRRVKVTTSPPQKVVVDGEMLGTTPIEVECIPQGLAVLVPQSMQMDPEQEADDHSIL